MPKFGKEGWTKRQERLTRDVKRYNFVSMNTLYLGYPYLKACPDEKKCRHSYPRHRSPDHPMAVTFKQYKLVIETLFDIVAEEMVSGKEVQLPSDAMKLRVNRAKAIFRGVDWNHFRETGQSDKRVSLVHQDGYYLTLGSEMGTFGHNTYWRFQLSEPRWLALYHEIQKRGIPITAFNDKFNDDKDHSHNIDF